MAHFRPITNCAACGVPIPEARLVAVPDTRWCVSCAESRVEKVGGNMVWHHKTAPVIEVKPMAQARRFAQQTRRHGYNASIKVDGITRTMDAPFVSWGKPND